jgi:LynF/TruF/PatF family peptide O-prenyltransferase
MTKLQELRKQFLQGRRPERSTLDRLQFSQNPMQRSFEQQFEKFRQHKQQFDIPSSSLLEIFETFAWRTQPELIEPSIKISGDKLLPQRCNLYFCDVSRFGQIGHSFFKLFEDLQQVLEEPFNYIGFAHLVNHGFNLECCENLVVGLDLRTELSASRVKMGFVLNQVRPELKQVIYEYDSRDSELTNLYRQRTDLFGIDYKFDGSCRLKAYPGFRAEELAQEDIGALFAPKTRALIEIAGNCVVAILDPFAPVQMTLTGEAISQIIDHPIISTLDSQGRYIVSLLPPEIEEEKIVHFNIYYI